MKKSLIIAFSLVLFGGIIFATPSSVTNFQVKQDGQSVSYSQFNSLISTIKGIFNQGFNNYNIGINTAPSEQPALKVNGLVKIVPMKESDRPNCDLETAGAIYSELAGIDGDGHLWGCNATDWVQLDTADPVCN